MKKYFFLFSILNFLFSAIAFAGANTIAYQGRLRESGQPVSGTRSVQFKVYDAASAGTTVFDSDPQSIYISSGIFGYRLGSNKAAGFPNFKDLNWATSSYWMEISVGGNAMSPREQINALPYAFMASSAVTAAGLNGSGNIQITGTGPHYITNGNVGIGKTNPTTKLQVIGAVNAYGYNSTGFSTGGLEGPDMINAYLFRQNIGGDIGFGRNYATILSNDAYYDGTNWIRRNQYTMPAILALGGDGTSSGVLRYMVGNAGSGPDQTFTPAEVFRITSAGYVGIGTTKPTGTFQVINESTFTILSNGQIGIGTTNPLANLHIARSLSGYDPINVAGLFVENSGLSNVYSVFQTATAGAGVSFCISNAGNVGIGVTNPSAKLFINGGANTMSGTLRLSCDGGSQYYASVGAGWATSDKRLKKDIKPIFNALDTVLRLQGRKFKWINPEEHLGGPGVQTGFIAQEVEEVIPEFVTEEKSVSDGGAWTKAGPDSKDLKLTNGLIKSVDMKNLNAYLVEALKELKAEKDAEINALKKEIEKLKNKQIK